MNAYRGSHRVAVTKKWFAVKCKYSPGTLHSHAACKLPCSMLLFGGEKNGEIVNELWRFHFGEYK